MKIKKIISAVLYTFLVVLFACKPATETAVTINFDASASGPFFVGPNSLIAEYNIKEISEDKLQELNLDHLQLVSIQKIKATLKSTNESGDSILYDSFSNASLQMVSPNFSMQSVGTKNPIASTSSVLNLNVVDGIDAKDYFKDKQFSLVLDLDFKEDLFINNVEAQVEIEFLLKHN